MSLRYKYFLEHQLISEEIVRKISDYLLINGVSVASSGLMGGKAGICLSLFELSRMLNDSILEDHAYNLLQEALVSKNENTDFANGLAGIGYALMYLIENKFVDADFDELFGENHKKIVDALDKKGSISSPLDLFYLIEANKYYGNFKEIITCEVNRYIRNITGNLTKNGLINSQNRMLTIGSFDMTIRFLYYIEPDQCYDQLLLQNMLNRYSHMEISDEVFGNVIANYYTISSLDSKHNTKLNKIYVQPSNLKGQLFLSHIASVEQESIVTSSFLFTDNIIEFEQRLIESLKSNYRPYSLGDGLAYLALYLAADNVKKSRFDKLFALL